MPSRAALVLAAATLLVGAVAVRTVVALYRGTFFPRDAAPVPPVPTATALPVSPSRGVR